ncbi:AzlD domain-containing protein [Limosilactobacillus ingluviei]|uniref:AzlD domain-containing protein n=1 Tax=Limosilactobacillus ingluviei TaxID=148604 RepID=UPI0003143B4D|nr:AzlD domain-containing protein [Limosilactobacillus ingluviei]MBM6728800.1 AzlD domain-containing protein [Limosilactobacillus ingluviei]MDO4603934.1 AzlD domain-containing protein [Limosilactobacillus ingluviei]
MDTFVTNLAVASLVPSHHNTVYHLIVIVVAAVAAFLPRYFPMRFFTNRKIPEWFNEWMKYVPVSLFTALVVKALFLDGKYQYFFDQVNALGTNVTVFGHASYLIAAVLVAIVAYFTRSMLSSVVVGLVAVWLLTFVL